MQKIFLGLAETWDDICSSDYGGLCCAPGMESRRYMLQEFPESWMQHEGYCKDQGGALVAFETRAEMDCIIQYMEDKFPVDRYPFSWAIGLASSFRYKGVIYRRKQFLLAPTGALGLHLSVCISLCRSNHTFLICTVCLI